MPLTTSRGYPYSIPTDTTDIPQAMEDLARAVDTDVEARDQSIHARPVFRLTGRTPITYSAHIAFVQNKVLPMEIQDVNVGGAIVDVSGTVDRIIPQRAGFWWFQASWTFPRSGATSMDMLGIVLQTGTAVLGRNSTHLPPPVSDGANNMYVMGGTWMNGTTDYVQVLGTAQTIAPAIGVPSMTIRNRYILGQLMVEG